MTYIYIYIYIYFEFVTIFCISGHRLEEQLCSFCVPIGYLVFEYDMLSN